MKRQQKEAEKDGTVLDMLGVMDGTFIYPTGANLPSWTKNPRGRWKVEFTRIWTAVTDFGMEMYVRIWAIRPRMWSGKKLEKHDAPRIAREIYESMYDNFARGTLDKVEKQLKPGLLGSLRSRFSQRPANQGMHWTLHRYVEKPRTMSFKFITLPGGTDTERNGIVQAVVKMRSKQSLLKVQRVRVKDETGKFVVQPAPVDEHGVMIPETEVEDAKERASKVTTEYVVLHRMMKKGKIGPWVMWGTAQESSLAKMEQDRKDLMAKQDQMAAMRGDT
jgi:protein MBA1